MHWQNGAHPVQSPCSWAHAATASVKAERLFLAGLTTSPDMAGMAPPLFLSGLTPAPDLTGRAPRLFFWGGLTPAPFLSELMANPVARSWFSHNLQSSHLLRFRAAIATSFEPGTAGGEPDGGMP